MSPEEPPLTLHVRRLTYSHRARSERLAGQAKCVSSASRFKQRTNSPSGRFHSGGNPPTYAKPSGPAQPNLNLPIWSQTFTHNSGTVLISPSFCCPWSGAQGNICKNVSTELTRQSLQNRIGGSLPAMNDGDSPAYPPPPLLLVKCPRHNWMGSTAGFWSHSLLSTYGNTEGTFGASAERC